MSRRAGSHGVSPVWALPVAADTCRVRSALPLPPQLQLRWFSAACAARAALGWQGEIRGLVNGGRGERAGGSLWRGLVACSSSKVTKEGKSAASQCWAQCWWPWGCCQLVGTCSASCKRPLQQLTACCWYLISSVSQGTFFVLFHFLNFYHLHMG